MVKETRGGSQRRGEERELGRSRTLSHTQEPREGVQA